MGDVDVLARCIEEALAELVETTAMVGRRGLVLGAGGVLGCGVDGRRAGAALEELEGFDCREGGHAHRHVRRFGHGRAARLRRLRRGDLVRYQRGMPAPGDPVIDYDDETTGGPLPPRPRLALGSPSLLAERRPAPAGR